MKAICSPPYALASSPIRVSGSHIPQLMINEHHLFILTPTLVSELQSQLLCWEHLNIFLSAALLTSPSFLYHLIGLCVCLSFYQVFIIIHILAFMFTVIYCVFDILLNGFVVGRC